MSISAMGSRATRRLPSQSYAALAAPATRPLRPLSHARVTHAARLDARRLGWISVILGVISMDVDALALFSGVIPLTRWYADLMLTFGPVTVVTGAMLLCGGPLALAGLGCASATLRRSEGAPASALLGVATSTLALAIPLCYALFVALYLRGLM